VPGLEEPNVEADQAHIDAMLNDVPAYHRFHPIAGALRERPTEFDIPNRIARATFEIGTEFTNFTGSVQGGIVASMLDEAMGLAAGAYIPSEMSFGATLETKITFLARAAPGQLLGEGRVLKVSKNIVFLSGQLFGADGRLCAVSSSTATIR